LQSYKLRRPTLRLLLTVAWLDLTKLGVRTCYVLFSWRFFPMKRMAVVTAVLFAGSISLSSALWAQDIGDADGGRQIRESQAPEPGFGSDPLDQQRSLDSSYDNDDAATNDDESSSLRKRQQDPDQNDQDTDNDKQNQDDQGKPDQIGSGTGDPMDQPEINDPAEKADPAETDTQGDQDDQGNADQGEDTTDQARFGLPTGNGRR
jgi:hypothetical protein